MFSMNQQLLTPPLSSPLSTRSYKSYQMKALRFQWGHFDGRVAAADYEEVWIYRQYDTSAPSTPTKLFYMKMGN